MRVDSSRETTALGAFHDIAFNIAFEIASENMVESCGLIPVVATPSDTGSGCPCNGRLNWMRPGLP